MAIGDFLFGREGQFKQAPSQYDPQQQQILQSLLQQGMQGLGTGAIEEQARRGFRQDTIPLLSERFANIGGRGLSGIGSSGYQNALQGAGTQLETNLAALRQGNAMNLLGLGLTPYQGEQYYEPGTEGIAGDLAKLGAHAGLAYATGGLSTGVNPTGIMDLFSSLFGGKKQDIGGEQFRVSGGRKPGLSTFTSPAGTGYSGFSPAEIQGLQSRQGTLSAPGANFMGGTPLETPANAKFTQPYGAIGGTYGPSPLASYLSNSGIGQGISSLLGAGGKSLMGLFR